jgi:cyclic pyranopterin phosphate synthase
MAAVRPVQTETRATDRLGRTLHDLRISVIDKCNLRCPYCMPLDRFGEGYQFLPESELLSFDEIEMVARAFARLGVRKLRITGGEPLLRKDLPRLIERLSAIDGIEDIALTTNGLLLRRQARDLKAAGLRRVTVSLDSLDDAASGRMNGRGVPVSNVLEGITAAQAAGFDAIKVNAVAQRGVNDHTVLDMVEHFRGSGVIVRFIEYMDVGTRNRWKLDEVVSSRELRDRVHARYPMRPVDPNYPGEVASRYSFDDGQGEVGFISSVTETFCGDCTRARISADGVLFTCLFATAGTDLRTPLREGLRSDKLETMLREVWAARDDRYSEMRAVQGPALGTKVEMYRVGG